MNGSKSSSKKWWLVAPVVAIVAVAAYYLPGLGLGRDNFGDHTVTISPSAGAESGYGGVVVPVKNISNTTVEADPLGHDPEDVYQRYMSAYDKLSTLIAQRRGNTPEASAVLAEYERLKKQYEELAGH
jgi:hypothetical protein